MNVIETETGEVAPLTETILPWWNVLPVVILLVALAFYYYKVAPSGGMLSEEDRRKLTEEDEVQEEDDEDDEKTPARRMEDSPVFALMLAALVVGYFAVTWSSGTFNFGLNELIAVFFLLGWLAHRRPIRYVRAFQNSIRAGGPIALQFPLYGVDGYHDQQRPQRGPRAGVRGFLFRGHPPLLVLHLFDNNQHIRALGWRTLGGAGAHDGAGRL